MAKDSHEKSVVKPGGNIVSQMAEEFQKQLLKAVEDGVKDLTVDLMDVDIIDPVGLGILIAAHNSFKEAGGNFRVINVPERIYTMFQTIHLDQDFEVIAHK